MNTYVLTVVACLFALTMVTRALPFLFAAKLSGHAKMQAVGKRLTSYIMMLLVIYEVNPESFFAYPHAMPAVLSLGVVIMVHLFFHKPLLSMVLGTASFVLLQEFF